MKIAPDATLDEIAAGLRRRDFTSVELVAEYLARARRCDARLGVYLTIFEDEALRTAVDLDAERRAGTERSALHGVPVAVKDIVFSREGATTAQSVTAPRAYGAGVDAALVANLRAAGAIVLGKTTTQEFALGLPDESKPFPIPVNPWDRRRWSGGSSSGSASGVAAGLFPGAVGTDTAGSIRVPAAFCGVVGLKPTYGLVSTDGVIPFAASCDHAGPIGRTAADCKRLLLGMLDEQDRLRVDAGSSSPPTLRGRIIGYVAPTSAGSVDEESATVYEDALQLLREHGAILRPFALPYFDHVRAAVTVVMACESTAQHMTQLRTRWNDYFRASRKSLSRGVAYSGAEYVQAQRVRTAAQDALRQAMAGYDCLVSPTCDAVAPPIRELLDDAEVFYRMMKSIHTMYWNGTGHPAVSVPADLSRDGLPLGVQFIGHPFDDVRLLAIAELFERVSAWRGRFPSVCRAA